MHCVTRAGCGRTVVDVAARNGHEAKTNEEGKYSGLGLNICPISAGPEEL